MWAFVGKEALLSIISVAMHEKKHLLYGQIQHKQLYIGQPGVFVCSKFNKLESNAKSAWEMPCAYIPI